MLDLSARQGETCYDAYGNRLYDFAVSDDGSTQLTLYGEGTKTNFVVLSGDARRRCPKKERFGHTDSVTSVAITPDGEFAITSRPTGRFGFGRP